MIFLAWVGVVLIISGLVCVILQESYLSKLWNTHRLGQHWVGFVLLLCAFAVIWQYEHKYIGYVVGLFMPCGLLLPALIGRYLYKISTKNHGLRSFTCWDFAFLSALQLLLMLSSWSILPWDIYRIGYTPWAILIAILLLAYAYLRGFHLIALVAITSLLLWATGNGNYFDWISHSALLIIAWVWLIWHVLALLFKALKTKLA